MNVSRLSAIGAALVFACVMGAAADAQTTIEVTLHAANGTHVEHDSTFHATGVVPVIRLEHRTKRLGAFLEAFPPGGPTPFRNPFPGNPQNTKISYIAGGLRYYSANGRGFLGLGATDINQATSFQPFVFTFGNATGTAFRDTRGEIDRSRPASVRYEAGALILDRKRTQAWLTIAANPSINNRLYIQQLSTFARYSNGTLTASSSYDNQGFEPERGSQMDIVLKFTTTQRGYGLLYGLRYVNYASRFTRDNRQSDRNLLLMPFLGFSKQIGR